MSELRAHQVEALEALRQSLRNGHRRPLLSLPTGSGKTRIAIEIARGALSRGKRVAFIAPALSIIDQTVAAFEAEKLTDLGVPQADHGRTDPTRPLQIVSAATLARRPLPAVDVAIVDEAHARHKATEAWLTSSPEMIAIGLSASPWSRGLGMVYDDLVVGASIPRLTKAGFLTPARVYAAGSPDLRGVRVVRGDFEGGALGRAMVAASVVENAVAEWIARSERRPTIAFAADLGHAAALAARFDVCGVPAEAITGDTPIEERAAVRNRLETGVTKVVVSVGTMIVGTDWPVTSCILAARPTCSPIVHVQSIGHGLRSSAGKTDAIVIDVAGNSLRLGRHDLIRCEALDDGSKGSRSVTTSDPVRACPDCRLVIRRTAPACPECGWVSEAERDRWLGAFVSIAADRGYHNRWAAERYRERFGELPRGGRTRPQKPTSEIWNFVRERVATWRAERAA